MELELFCVHGQEKCVSLTQKPGSHQRRVPGAGCGSAAICSSSSPRWTWSVRTTLCTQTDKCVFLTQKPGSHQKGYLQDSGPKDIKCQQKSVM